MITAHAGIKNIYFNNQLIKKYFFKTNQISSNHVIHKNCVYLCEYLIKVLVKSASNTDDFLLTNLIKLKNESAAY
ncbi:hypothetical protein D7216_06770 [Legionella pneumophila]|nr:hypothetical protein D7216_06770 [Legionella pneumophila]